MFTDLLKLGMLENKAHRLVLPIGIPNKYLGDFIRGYFDGDGNVWTGVIHKDRKVQYASMQCAFTSCSGDFLQALKNRLTEEGISGGSLVKRDGYSRLQYSTKNALHLYKLMYDNGWITGLYLSRKKVIFDRFIEHMRA